MQPETTAPSTSETQSVARMALRSTLWATIGNYAVQIIGFGSVLLLTRLLKPEVFGVLSLAMFWTGLLNLRNKLGLNYAAVQYETDARLLGTYLIVDGLATGLSFVLIAACGLILTATGLYSSTVAWVMVGMTGIELALVWSGPLGIAIERALLLSRSSLVAIGATLVAYTAGILLALNGAGIWSMLAIPAINFTISSFGALWICRRFMPQLFTTRWVFDRSLAINLLKRGSTIGLSTALLAVVVAQFDNFLIGTFVGAETLGYYDRAYRIASWVNLILTMVVSRVGYVTMVRVVDDPARLSHTVRLSVWIVLTLGIPLALATSFTAPDLTRVLYGTIYASSADFLRVLAITNCMWTLISVGFWLSAARKQRRVNLFMSSAHAFALAAIALPLTLAFGAFGTLAGVAIAMSLALIASAIYIERVAQLGWWATYGAHAIATAVTCGALFSVSTLLAGIGAFALVRLIVLGATSLSSFAVCLFLLRRHEIGDRLDYLLSRWKSSPP